MPGAGTSTLAFAPETTYLGGVGGSPTYYLPGTNPTVQTAELNRNLLDLVLPGNVESDDFIAQQLEGQLSVQFVLQNIDFHRLIFNAATNKEFGSGLANSAEWYLGVDTKSGTTERQIKGWIPASCQIQYNGSTETATVTLTGPYGDEARNTTITPGTIANTSTGNEVPGHGASLDIGGAPVERLQSATLEMSQIARLIRGSTKPQPVDAVAGNVQTSVDLSAVYLDSERYEQALGSASATTAEDFIGSRSATVTFDHDGSTIVKYNIDDVKPDTYGWSDLVNNDADLNETINYSATGIAAASSP
jgi:hypothetical protein